MHTATDANPSTGTQDSFTVILKIAYAHFALGILLDEWLDRIIQRGREVVLEALLAQDGNQQDVPFGSEIKFAEFVDCHLI